MYVIALPDEPMSNVLAYISSIYSRLWDEMIQNEALGLKCFVVGDVEEYGLISRRELRNMPDLQAFYTCDSHAIEAACLERANAGLPALFFTDLTSSTLSAKEMHAEAEELAEGQIYYFDLDGQSIPTFGKVAVGGTFDALHNGHRKLITLAAGACNGTLVVGITGDAMLTKKKNADLIPPFKFRSSNVKAFLDAVKPNIRFEPVELTDPWGPAITDACIEAIVVSSETLAGAAKINKMRTEKGMNPLAVLVTRRSEAATLSSTFLRSKAVAKRTSKRQRIMLAIRSFFAPFFPLKT